MIRKKLFVVLMAVIFIVGNIKDQNIYTIHASADGDDENETIIPEIIPTKGLPTVEVTPGETVHVSFLARLNTYLKDQILTIESENPHIEVTSDITLSRANSQPPIQLDQSYETRIEFDVQAKDTAKKGKYNLTLKATGSDIYGNYHGDITMKQPVVIKVSAEKSEPNLVISDLNIPEEVKPGEEFDVTFSLSNAGGLTARNTTIMIDGFGADGIIPAYTKSRINQGDIKSNGFNSVTIPMKASKDAEGGYKTLTVKLSCKDSDKNEYPVEVPIYINIKGSGGSLGDPNLLITDVTQSLSSPKAGGKVTLSFNIENQSDSDLTEIKITPTNLSNASFTPIKSEPYRYISKLAAGKKKKVKMNLIVSKEVTEGLNELEISYTYKDDTGKAYGPLTAKLFVLNVVGMDESKTPKLIISDFKTSEESLKAGKSFDFSFDVFNTNSKVSARNIKVTLSSTDNIFSVTKGSNSFYIPVIKPGETRHNLMNLKVKSDSVTKSYPLEIKFEYEYEGMPVPEDGTVSAGVTVSEILNLQVEENARPAVSNIMLGYGEPSTVNSPTTLNFEFYNLGKSVLSNVTAKIDSTDFTASSAMLFIGNVEAGSGDVYEMEITPMMEGQAKGNLIISYEDSNGDTIEVPTPFEAAVEPTPEMNPDMSDPAMNPDTANVKKEIVNAPVFVLIQIVLFFIMIPVGRKIRIDLYKKKIRKQEEDSI